MSRAERKAFKAALARANSGLLSAPQRVKYREDQARHPAGTEEGGRFAPEDGAASSSAPTSSGHEPVKTRVISDAAARMNAGWLDEYFAISRRRDQEVGAIIDAKTGELLRHQVGLTAEEAMAATGATGAVKWRQEDVPKMRGNLVVHTHPAVSDTGFSDQDVVMAFHHGVAEARVETPNATWSLVNPEPGKSPDFNADGVRLAYEFGTRIFMASEGAKYSQDERDAILKDPVRRERLIDDMVASSISAIADKLGWELVVTARPGGYAPNIRPLTTPDEPSTEERLVRDNMD